MRAHPRSRGENWAGTILAQAWRGSSPLTRGKPDLAVRSWGCAGLIPAHAGKTGVCMSCGHSSGAHPRSRGENAVVGGQVVEAGGSSPLTRGKRLVLRVQRRICRLIPAHAGKTAAPDLAKQVLKAHPRSRGENGITHQGQNAGQGSSPLTRGKPATATQAQGLGGLIPAHAGKTGNTPGYPQGRWAHPRSRGEN